MSALFNKMENIRHKKPLDKRKDKYKLLNMDDTGRHLMDEEQVRLFYYLSRGNRGDTFSRRN